VELEVFTDEASWVVGVEATVRIAMERRTCAGGGLSREETVKLSKLTRGQEARVVRECWLAISQEKVMFSISQQRNSFAEIVLLCAASHSMDSAMATAEVEKEE